MRHHNKNKKLGRERNQRKALLRTLALSLVIKEKIKTTEPKARALRPFVERLITQGKKKTLAAKRNINAEIGPKGMRKIVDALEPRFKDRKGGYTRIIKLPRRKSDDSRMAIIELVSNKD